MAELNGDTAHKLDKHGLRKTLFSSSTKRRISELSNIHERLVNGGRRPCLKYEGLATDASSDLEKADIRYLLELFAETYAFYADRESRRAVQRCIRTITASSDADDVLPSLIQFLTTEAAKPGIAPANAFVLVEWCSILLQDFADHSTLWNKWGIDVVAADSQVLELCVGSAARESVKHSAVVVTRRALRRVFGSEELGKGAVSSIVEQLASKGSSPTARHSVLLGVTAGVAARLESVKPELEHKKKDYITFYTREIIGSRVALPKHIAEGLHDFFENFVGPEELEKEIIPSVEKALLRAPEVVLNDLVSPLLRSVSHSIDQADILHKQLLKPLLSNIKSTNATIKAGAVATFETTALRSHDEATVGKIADEILNPLKSGKVTAADQ
ncbi:hypothetical protein LTS18_014736, partial [Coniosporium uncinatum]